MSLKPFYLAILLGLLANVGYAQKQTAFIKGRVVDGEKKPFDEANVQVLGTNIGGSTNKDGYFTLNVPANKPIVLEISHINMNGNKLHQLKPLKANQTKEITISAQRGVHLAPIDFEATRGTKGTTFTVLEPEKLEIPNPSGGIETAIKLLAGVNSSNELSSQYSVRGGSFDENLVYINGIEIYRPFLNRSGQSEGLSIINPNMVSSLAFSAGGFSAYYGDKLSSVLDITYKKPQENAVLLQGSFLGGSAHVEGRTDNYKLNYMFSTRYWSNRYLLNSLDVQGSYNPSFTDFQSFVTYRLSEKASLSWLGYFGDNSYQNVPETQTTKFGTIKDAKQLTVYYRGQEITEYQTFLNALQLEIKPHDSLNLSFSSSIYRADESERFDVLGQYFLSQLDNEIGSETFGDPKYVLGVGSYLNHARNFLLATIANVQHRGDYSSGAHKLSWGAVLQREIINDKLKEWRYLDSAGYAVPRGNPQAIDMSELVVSDISLNNNRTSAYVQDEWMLNRATNTKLNLGLRANYWSYSQQFLVAPRLSFSFEPNRDHNAKALALGYGKDSLKRNLRINFLTIN
ncbi:MAG: TonB-dependent receptor [Bacteroidia bacterium]